MSKENRKAPANELPTWEACNELAVNEAPMTHLQNFIYYYDDSDDKDSAWFMHRLELAIKEAKENALSEFLEKHKSGNVCNRSHPHENMNAECRLQTIVARVNNLKRQAETAPFICKFCGADSWVDPSDQTPPADVCHDSDHEKPED